VRCGCLGAWVGVSMQNSAAQHTKNCVVPGTKQRRQYSTVQLLEYTYTAPVPVDVVKCATLHLPPPPPPPPPGRRSLARSRFLTAPTHLLTHALTHPCISLVGTHARTYAILSASSEPHSRTAPQRQLLALARHPFRSHAIPVALLSSLSLLLSSPLASETVSLRFSPPLVPVPAPPARPPPPRRRQRRPLRRRLRLPLHRALFDPGGWLSAAA
jgi:hypothetical protein